MNLVVATRRPILAAEGGGLKDKRAAPADADEVGEELVEAAGRRRGFARQAVVAAAAGDEQEREDDGDQQEEEEDIGGRQMIDEVTHAVSRGAAALQHEEANSRWARIVTKHGLVGYRSQRSLKLSRLTITTFANDIWPTHRSFVGLIDAVIDIVTLPAYRDTSATTSERQMIIMLDSSRLLLPGKPMTLQQSSLSCACDDRPLTCCRHIGTLRCRRTASRRLSGSRCTGA